MGIARGAPLSRKRRSCPRQALLGAETGAYPLIRKQAPMVAAVPPSSVAVERVFLKKRLIFNNMAARTRQLPIDCSVRLTRLRIYYWYW
jgi:hypothetical protein